MYAHSQRAPFDIDFSWIRATVTRVAEFCRGEAIAGADLRGLPDYVLRDFGFDPASMHDVQEETITVSLVHVGWTPRQLGGRAD